MVWSRRGLRICSRRRQGLHLVQALSERWGIVRAAEGPTCVWVQLPRALLSHQPLAREERKPIGVATEM